MNEIVEQEQRIGLLEAARAVFPDGSKGVAYLRKAILDGKLSDAPTSTGANRVLLSEVRALDKPLLAHSEDESSEDEPASATGSSGSANRKRGGSLRIK